MKSFGISACILAFALTANAAATKSIPLDTKASQVKWVGTKITKSSHNGTVDLKEGSVTFSGKSLTAGTFTIDMTTIKNLDLTDAKMNQKLVGHLTSDDFFAVQAHPTAAFKITKVEDSKSGDIKVTGDLTIKGITKPVTFPATMKFEGGVYTATGKLTINRTQWDIKYNSGSYFDPKKLGDKLINDDIEIELSLRTVKS